MPKTKPVVLMIGPDLKVKGGVSAVINTLMNSSLKSDYRLIHIASHIDKGYIVKFCKALRALIKYLFFLCTGKVDIVHVHMASRASFYRKLVFFILAKLSAKKVIVHLHGGGFHQFYKRAGKITQKVIKWLFKRADAVIAVSKLWAERVKKIAQPHILTVVYNSIKVGDFNTGKERAKSSGIVLALGRLCKRKGTYDIIEVAPEIINKFPQVQFILAGNGELDKVRQLLREKQLEQYFQVPGWLNDKEKLQKLARADIFLIPSYFEGLPMSLVEAVASGLPIIASRVGGIPEAVTDGENGFLIDAGQLNRLKEKTLLLLGDPALRQEMGQKSCKLAQEKFDVSNAASTINNLYETLLRM